MLLDNDKAGNTTAEQIVQGLERLGIRAVAANGLLPEGRDPGDLDKDEVALLSKQLVDSFDKL